MKITALNSVLISVLALGCGAEIQEGELEEIDESAEALTCTGSSLCGDINGDGAVTVTDGVLAGRVAAGLETISSCQKLRADVNNSGTVTVTDQTLILQKAAGNAVTLNCAPYPNNPRPPQPIMISPANGFAYPYRTTMTFQWGGVTSATNYAFRLQDMNTGDVVQQPILPANQTSITTPVTGGHWYTWWVQAINANNIWSLDTHWSFSIAACADNGQACSGKQCGSAVNNCGQTVSCGGCGSGYSCSGNSCVANAPSCIGQGQTCVVGQLNPYCCPSLSCVPWSSGISTSYFGTCSLVTPPKTCKNPGGFCATSAECCNGATCQGGICSTASCRGSGSSCGTAFECCSRYCTSGDHRCL